MSSFTKSPFGKRLCMLQEDLDHHPPPTNRRPTDENDPEPHDYGGRFIPAPDGGMRTTYHLRNGDSACSNMSQIIPSKTGAAAMEQENASFKSILNTRVAPSEHSHPVCSPALPSIPPSTPTSHRLFAYHSPSVFSSRTAGRNGGFRDGVKEGMKTGATQPAMKAVREEEEVNGGDGIYSSVRANITAALVWQMGIRPKAVGIKNNLRMKSIDNIRA
ncbi:hypothetical protein B0H13DRAFT_1910626 [Mycena leptocephala]|nr:hypothetical protein B0H13DRAFT_1910626 [Mycena leptocephala]